MGEALSLVIKEHIQFHKQIFKLAKSDLIKTYRGAALGWSWVIVKPAMTLFVFWFAFSIGLRHGKPIAGYPFFLWLAAGMLPWFYMQEMITGGAGCIRKYRHLVTKMKFPISVIPTYFSLSHLYTNLALHAIVIGLFACFGFMPDIYYLQLPVYLLLMFLFFTVWSLFAGLLSAISIDFQNLVRSLSTMIFWMSGIIYDANSIENPTLRAILKVNPVTFLATGYRNVFIYKRWIFDRPKELLAFFIVLLIFSLAALWAFKKLRKEISDVL